MALATPDWRLCRTVIFKSDIKFLSSSKKNIIAIIFLLIIICIDLISAFCMKKLGAPLQSYVKQPFRIWTWIFYFYCGGLIRGVNHQVVDKIIEKKYIILIISVVINLAYDYGIGYKVLGIEWAEYFYDNIFMIFECVFVFLIFKEIEVHNWNAEKWIYELSSLSMGVFVIHVVIIKYIEQYYDFCLPIFNFGLWGIVFGVSIVISKIISKIPIAKRLIKL